MKLIDIIATLNRAKDVFLYVSEIVVVESDSMEGVCILSWRWDLNKDGITSNIAVGLRKACGTGFKYMICDLFFVDQNSPSKIAQVQKMQTLYAELPVICSYGHTDRSWEQIFLNFDKAGASRGWINREMQIFKDNPFMGCFKPKVMKDLVDESLAWSLPSVVYKRLAIYSMKAPFKAIYCSLFSSDQGASKRVMNETIENQEVLFYEILPMYIAYWGLNGHNVLAYKLILNIAILENYLLTPLYLFILIVPFLYLILSPFYLCSPIRTDLFIYSISTGPYIAISNIVPFYWLSIWLLNHLENLISFKSNPIKSKLLFESHFNEATLNAALIQSKEIFTVPTDIKFIREVPKEVLDLISTLDKSSSKLATDLFLLTLDVDVEACELRIPSTQFGRMVESRIMSSINNNDHALNLLGLSIKSYTFEKKYKSFKISKRPQLPLANQLL